MTTHLTRRRALIEIVLFSILVFGLRLAFDPLFWRYAGPAALVVSIGALMAYLLSRGVGWSSVGLAPLKGRRALAMLLPQVLLTFVFFAIAISITVFGGEAIGLEFMSEEPPGVADRWGDVPGNLRLYLTWLAIVWTTAAFGEEIFFRGFLITRFQAVFAGVPFAKVAAVLVAALIFGVAHFYYQGMRGLITTAAIGVAFGAAFLLFKRNLWPVVIMHGIIDTLTFSALYFEWE